MSDTTRTKLGQRWESFWFAPVGPGNLGFLRLIFFGLLAVFYFGDDLTTAATVPDALFRPKGFFEHLHLPVASPEVMAVLAWLFKGALVFAAIGLFTGPTTALVFVLSLYVLGLQHQFGRGHHKDALLVLFFGILALSRCGDAWSIDALRKRARSAPSGAVWNPAPSGEYRWPVRMCWVGTICVFWAAGLMKLTYGGLDWALSDRMAYLLVNHHYSHDPLLPFGLFFASVPLIAKGSALATLVIEAGQPLALVSRKARWVFIGGMFGCQVGIGLLLGIWFTQFFVVYLFWVPFDRIGNWLQAKLAKQPTLGVMFDGGCGICRSTVAVLHRLDLFGKLKFYDMTRDYAEIEERYPHLDAAAMAKDMHAVRFADVHVAAGYEAYRLIAARVPALWVMVPLMGLPPVAWVGKKIYRHVADGRLNKGCATSGESRPPRLFEAAG
ncbi:MAG: DCC1-like thiol-disulfide oxidoreductase family protein [Planctomycetota bacterium]